MQINLSGHHVDLTDALRNHVNEKFEKLERHFDQLNSVQVILTVEKNKQKAESIVRITGGELFAHSEEDDMYTAIDILVDKLDRQIIKHKEKEVARKHGS